MNTFNDFLQKLYHGGRVKSRQQLKQTQTVSFAELMAAMKFTHAIVCRIPQSYRTKCDVDLAEAKKQHETFVKLLRELGLDVIELPPDEILPQCVFVEDTALVRNGNALITRLESPRIKEVSFIYILCFLIVSSKCLLF